MADYRTISTRETKERLGNLYRELLDRDNFLEEIPAIKHQYAKELGTEFLSAVDKLAELYSSKKGCKLDPEMVLIDLESLECGTTKTFFKLESDINIMKKGREDVNQILKAKQLKVEDKPTRLRNVQKEKSKLKDFQFILNTYKNINALSRIALFEELEKFRGKVEEQLDHKKKIDAKVAEFWKKWPKSCFIECSLKANATEKAGAFFKELLAAYSKTYFRCEGIENQLGLIDNLLKATVLRVGKNKVSFSIFEKIFEQLLTYPGLPEECLMLSDMRRKRDVCEQLKDLEAKLKENQLVSFEAAKDYYHQFKAKCEEIDLKGTEDFVGLMVKKAEPVLSKLKSQLTQDELLKISSQLAELPYNLEEAKKIELRIKQVEEFVQKFQDIMVVANPDLLVTEYRRLDTRIPSFEVIIKKMENDKGLIGAVIGEANTKLEWSRGIKLLQRLKSVSMMDQKQAQALIINKMLHQLTQRFLHYLKKRNLCSIQESDEVILETCNLVQKTKRLDFLKREKISGEELATVVKIIEVVLDEQSVLVWNAEDWMRDKEFEINDLGYNQRFLRNLCKDLDLSLEHDQVLTELPHGAYLEDFVKGYAFGRSSIEGTSTDYLKGVIQEIQKNLEKNPTFELTKFAAYLEAERIFSEIIDSQTCPRKFENQIQRLNHFLWKIRIYKHDQISSVIRTYMFEPKVIQRLANRSDATLKKMEQKLKGNRKLKKLYLRGSKYFNKPDKIVSKENKLRAAEEKDQAERKKNGLRDIHDDWKGLHAHFKVPHDPGMEKSKDFEIIFTHLRCKDLCKPPMYIVFSKELTNKEFSDRVYQAAQSRSKELEIGAFSSTKTRYLRKSMVRKGAVFQANLDGCNLYLFAKEQWPSQRLLSVTGQSHLDQQLRVDSDLYCLLNFVPVRDRSTGQGDGEDFNYPHESKHADGRVRSHPQNHQQFLKKRDSSSIFDLEEGQEGWEEIAWEDGSDNPGSDEQTGKPHRKREKGVKHPPGKDRRKLYIEEDELSDKPKAEPGQAHKDPSRHAADGSKFKKQQDTYMLRDKHEKTDTAQRSGTGLKSAKSTTDANAFNPIDKVATNYTPFQAEELDNWEIPRKKLYKGPPSSDFPFQKQYPDHLNHQSGFFGRHSLEEQNASYKLPLAPHNLGSSGFFMKEAEDRSPMHPEEHEHSNFAHPGISGSQNPIAEDSNEQLGMDETLEQRSALHDEADAGEELNQSAGEEDGDQGNVPSLHDLKPAAVEASFSSMVPQRVTPAEFITKHIPISYVMPEDSRMAKYSVSNSQIPDSPQLALARDFPPHNEEDVSKKYPPIARKQKQADIPAASKTLLIELEEISEDVASHQSDYDDCVPPEEEDNFEKLFHEFELLNPDFKYDSGTGDADLDPQQMGGDPMFVGNLDLNMAQEMLPQNAPFLNSHSGYLSGHQGYGHQELLNYPMMGNRGMGYQSHNYLVGLQNYDSSNMYRTDLGNSGRLHDYSGVARGSGGHAQGLSGFGHESEFGGQGLGMGMMPGNYYDRRGQAQGYGHHYGRNQGGFALNQPMKK